MDGRSTHAPLIMAVKHDGTESPHFGRDPPRLIRAAFREGWKRGAGIYTPSPLLEPEEGGSLIWPLVVALSLCHHVVDAGPAIPY